MSESPVADPRRVVLAHVRDDRGLMHREVAMTTDGGLAVVGHDLGPGVCDFFGEGTEEYEFERRVDADGVRRLVEALGGGDVLDLVRARFATTRELEVFLDEQGIPSTFWNRVG